MSAGFLFLRSLRLIKISAKNQSELTLLLFAKARVIALDHLFLFSDALFAVLRCRVLFAWGFFSFRHCLVTPDDQIVCSDVLSECANTHLNHQMPHGQAKTRFSTSLERLLSDKSLEPALALLALRMEHRLDSPKSLNPMRFRNWCRATSVVDWLKLRLR